MMTMMTIDKFCDMHNACSEGRAWASANYTSMQDVWDRGDNIEYMLWVATRPGVLTAREKRLFACWCVRQVWHLLTDERSRHAVEVAERYALGEATGKELDVARAAALDAARDAGSYSARHAAWAAALVAQWDAVWSAASCAATASARGDALIAQLAYLRRHTSVNLDDPKA